MDYIAETALTSTGGRRITLRLPAALARSLISEGYTRAKVYVTEDGILLKPFAAEAGLKMVELPEWSDE